MTRPTPSDIENALGEPLKWQSIDTAPRDGTEVLLTNPRPGAVCVGFWNGKSWDDGDFYDDLGDFTHWMPLPEPPESV
jgi:hypothetical protein